MSFSVKYFSATGSSLFVLLYNYSLVDFLCIVVHVERDTCTQEHVVVLLQLFKIDVGVVCIVVVCVYPRAERGMVWSH